MAGCLYLTIGIVKNLYDAGVPSSAGKEKWNKRATETMLVNEKYTRTVTRQDSAAQEYAYRMKACIPSIITESEFQTVQKEKKKRSNIAAVGEGAYCSRTI